MEKLQRRLAVNALLFVFSGAGIVLLAKMRIPRYLSFLRWAVDSEFGLMRALRMRPTLALALGFLVLVLIALIAGLRCVGIFFKMARLTAQQNSGQPGPTRPAAPSAPTGAGMEKYLRQLDDMLRSGLIDRAEYRALREKYERQGKRDGQ